ncbi:MAG: hypothetical protein QM538_02880 [Methylacidiphilales bacterium]|nr:hypothetical protein [Candidatus Methylacidiphilales bacterium]
MYISKIRIGVIISFLAFTLTTSYADSPYAQFSFLSNAESFDFKNSFINPDSGNSRFTKFINLENRESAFGFSFGFGEFIGNTSRFEWNLEYFPTNDNLFNSEGDITLSWGDLAGPTYNAKVGFSRTSTTFNFTMGLSDDPEFLPYIMLGTGISVLLATPTKNNIVPKSIIDAAKFTFYTINFGVGIEGTIDEYWTMDIGYRVQQSFYSIGATFNQSVNVSINKYNNSGFYLTFRRTFDRR